MRRTIVVLVAVVAVGFALWQSGALARVAPQVAPASCTVGLAGAAVSVTAQGPGAESQCDSFLGQTTDGGSWYVYQGDAQPGGAVVCQVTLNGDLFTVRDTGSTLYGNSICQNLLKQAASAQAAPLGDTATIGPDQQPVPVAQTDGAVQYASRDAGYPVPAAPATPTPECVGVDSAACSPGWYTGQSDSAGARCRLGVAGHDAVLVVIDSPDTVGEACTWLPYIIALPSSSWVYHEPDAGQDEAVICDVSAAGGWRYVVHDTGTASYGSAICRQLSASLTPPG